MQQKIGGQIWGQARPPITNDPIGTSSLLQPTVDFKMKGIFNLCT